MGLKQIDNQINEIENENNINLKYENIIKLHKIIDNEEETLEKISNSIDRNISTKYDNMELNKIISKFDKTDNIEKKIKYYHSISNKIDDIINTINN